MRDDRLDLRRRGPQRLPTSLGGGRGARRGAGEVPGRPAAPPGAGAVIRAVDLCCGAGGWACAARGLPIEWVAVADRSSDCLSTWRLNHGEEHAGCAILRIDLATP